jgi:ketosteroid isomerase-like protein
LIDGQIQQFGIQSGSMLPPQTGGTEMSKKLVLVVVSFSFALLPAARPQSSPRQAPVPSATARELTDMLNQFLADVPKNNPASYDRFFADDVIYTRNTGAVTTKADIIKSVSASAGRAPRTETTTTFSAEDVTIHEYTDVAVVAFRLVAHEAHSDGKPPTITNYRDTGTFLRRNGRWQVVSWQATKIAEDAAPAK